MTTIILEWPPSTLSGHNNGSWYDRSPIVARFRRDAWLTTLEAKITVPETGDIPIHFRFVPPNRRSDRVNFPNRLKAQIDGIADALKVNDRRFLPSYEYAEPEAPGRVEVTIGGPHADHV